MVFREVKFLPQKALLAVAPLDALSFHFTDIHAMWCRNATNFTEVFLAPNPLVTVNMAYEGIQIRSYLCFALHHCKLAGYVL